MNNFFTLILLLTNTILNSLTPSNEDYLIIYELTFKEKNSSSNYKTTNMRLYVNENSSIYLDQFTVFEYLDKKNGKAKTPGSRAPIEHIVYKDFENKKTQISQPIKPKNVGYIINYYSSKDWKVTNEKSKINNYTCFKATTTYGGRDWMAWFTREVPLSEGPYIFSGLPGLIVKLQSIDGDFRFNLTDVSKIKKGDLYPIKPKPQIITKEKFHYYLKNKTKILKDFLLTKTKDIAMTKNGVPMTQKEMDDNTVRDDKDRIQIEYKKY